MDFKSYTIGFITALLLIGTIGGVLAIVGGGIIDNGDGTATMQFTAPINKWVNYANWNAEQNMRSYYKYLKVYDGCTAQYDNFTICDTTTKRVQYLYIDTKSYLENDYSKLKMIDAAREAGNDGDNI